MQIDLRTVTIEPHRQAFDHLIRRFGDKPASRYQEGSYDLQASENLHYRPTWDPEQALYDPELSRVRMADWYVLKDPRQYYYSTYTLARANRQDAVETDFKFVESRRLIETMPDDTRKRALSVLVPLRHAAWGANQNNTLVCGYGYGTTFTQPCLYYAMDCLGIAQYLSRIGLMLDGPDALKAGKDAWTQDPAWQGLRRYVEDSMVVRDPVEVFIAQNVALDGILYPLIYDDIVQGELAAQGGPALSLLTQFMTDWSSETTKWIDAVVKVMAAESESNRSVLTEWVEHWATRAVDALTPVATLGLGERTGEVVTDRRDALYRRLGRLGLSLGE